MAGTHRLLMGSQWEDEIVAMGVREGVTLPYPPASRVGSPSVKFW